jgi:hypothetical protein
MHALHTPPLLFSVCIRLRHWETMGSSPFYSTQRPATKERRKGELPVTQVDFDHYIPAGPDEQLH